MFRKISACFAGGTLGALVDSINIWGLGKFGITALLGIGLRPEFSPAWLYPRLVWGGIWGLLFMLPLLEKQVVTRGIVFSLAPTAMVLFVVFPGMGKGTYGLGFGILTPILVILLNFIWGIVAAYWYRQSR
jgi:hypothetical protein